MDYATARRHMVDSQVRTNDVADLRIQSAMKIVPREAFLPVELRDQAYVERELPTAPGRVLLTARDFSKLLAAADPQPADVVLDVACGPGYSTAVLACLCEMAVAVEADEAACAKAQENLRAAEIDNAAVIVGDPTRGAPKQGPFGLIFIGGAIEVDPVNLFAQLKDRGRLVAIKRIEGVSRGVIYRKDGDDVSSRIVFDAATKATLPEFAAPKKFTF